MRKLSIIFIILSGVIALWIASTPWGIGYDPDSIIYEDVAENWRAGYGIARFDFATGERYPMTNFPPMYPLILGILSSIVGTVAQAAKILNTALWAVVWLLVYGWIRRGTPTYQVALALTTFALFNLLVLQVFGTSWSEPLFMVVGFSGLWLLLIYREQWQGKYLILASLLFAVAILTRYAGVALVATAGIMLLTATDKTWRDRVLSLGILCAVSGLPLLIWLIRNITVRGDVANRDLGFTLVGLPQLESTLQTLGSWLIPVPEIGVNLFMVGLVAGLFAWSAIRTRHYTSSPDTGIQMMRWWIIIYMLFIIVSFMLLDPRIPFNYRILLPAYLGLVILIGRWLALRWQSLSKGLQFIWLVGGLVLIVINSILSINWAMIVSRTGQQYSDVRFQQSTLIQDLRNKPNDAILYTNNNFLLHYLTSKPARILPSVDTIEFNSWLQSLPAGEPIQIVYFTLLSQRGWDTIAQIESRLPVDVISQSEIVTLYQLDIPSE